MTKKKFEYTGVDNLEVMSEAHNYNNYLIEIVQNAQKLIKKDKPKILDFGAGSGTYTDMLKEKGITAECLEPDSKLQGVLKKKGYKVYGDVSELKPESYDLIYALNVFEHIKNDEQVVKKLKKVLRPGGRLVIYVPAFQLLFTSMDEKVGHYRRYRKSMLSDYAHTANLNVEKLYYCDPIGFSAALAYRIFGNKEGNISPTSVKYYDRFAFPLSKVIQPLTRSFVGKNVLLVAVK